MLLPTRPVLSEAGILEACHGSPAASTCAIAQTSCVEIEITPEGDFEELSRAESMFQNQALENAWHSMSHEQSAQGPASRRMTSSLE